jgi:hypothetical protein
MNREAFERWVCDLNRAPTAWEAWQAAQAQTLLEVIRDDSGCPTEVRIAEALQHAGQGEAVAEIALSHGGYPVCRWLKGDEENYAEGTKLYTHPQPSAIESLASWMLSRGFSTGHGDTIDDLLIELDGQIDDLQHAGQGEVPFDFAQPVLDPYYAGRILSVIAESTPQPAVPDGWIKVMRGMAEYAECNDPRNPYLQQAQALLRAGKGGE